MMIVEQKSSSNAVKGDSQNMKKLMTLMLGLSFLTACVAVSYADEATTATKKTKATKTKATKAKKTTGEKATS